MLTAMSNACNGEKNSIVTNDTSEVNPITIGGVYTLKYIFCKTSTRLIMRVIRSLELNLRYISGITGK